MLLILFHLAFYREFLLMGYLTGITLEIQLVVCDMDLQTSHPV